MARTIGFSSEESSYISLNHASFLINYVLGDEYIVDLYGTVFSEEDNSGMTFGFYDDYDNSVSLAYSVKRSNKSIDCHETPIMYFCNNSNYNDLFFCDYYVEAKKCTYMMVSSTVSDSGYFTPETFNLGGSEVQIPSLEASIRKSLQNIIPSTSE